MTNMLKTLMEKSTQHARTDIIDNVSREMKILRKNQKVLLEIKITVTEMMNAFDGLVH